MSTTSPRILWCVAEQLRLDLYGDGLNVAGHRQESPGICPKRDSCTAKHLLLLRETVPSMRIDDRSRQ